MARAVIHISMVALGVGLLIQSCSDSDTATLAPPSPTPSPTCPPVATPGIVTFAPLPPVSVGDSVTIDQLINQLNSTFSPSFTLMWIVFPEEGVSPSMSTEASPTFTFSEPGSYEINVQVFPPPPPPGCLFTPVALGSTTQVVNPLVNP